MWVISEITPEFVERMNDVLEVYERPYNRKRPVVCMDEKSKQLLKETRKPKATKPGKRAKADYEYKRNGTCNIFVAVEPKGKKRAVRVTKRRTMGEYAYFIKHLVDDVYKRAEKLILIEDNLNIHHQSSLTTVFGETEGERIGNNIEWHWTPKHASWLDQAEIEIHSLEQQCLNRRIPDLDTMASEVAACVKKRNKDKCGIKWQFTRKKAKKKFHLA